MSLDAKQQKVAFLALLAGAFTIIIANTWSSTIQKLYDMYIHKPSDNIFSLLVYSSTITVISFIFIYLISKL